MMPALMNYPVFRFWETGMRHVSTPAWAGTESVDTEITTRHCGHNFMMPNKKLAHQYLFIALPFSS
jgi:hypothetical protein